jgi:ATP-dependent Clp protease ATP-binding subunit ClpA
MFERFTYPARRVVVRAQEEARTFRHPWLGTEHLLLGVLAQPQAPGVSVLTELGVTLDRGRAALGQVVGTGGLGESDADALRTLGIDLDEVSRRVEASFGPGELDDHWLALNVSRQRPRRQRRWRRRRCEQAT